MKRLNSNGLESLPKVGHGSEMHQILWLNHLIFFCVCVEISVLATTGRMSGREYFFKAEQIEKKICRDRTRALIMSGTSGGG